MNTNDQDVVVPDENVRDKIFINLVAQVAAKHGCEIKDINFKTKNIDLDCPTDAQSEACAIELEQVFSQLAV